jgi:hypothetical protein
MDAAQKRVEQAMHKLAEVLYKSQPGGAAEPAAGGRPGGSEASNGSTDGEVIDAEYTEDKGGPQ